LTGNAPKRGVPEVISLGRAGISEIASAPAVRFEVHLFRPRRMIRNVNARCREANMRAQFAVVAMTFSLTVSMTLDTPAFAQDAARLAAGEAAWDKAGCLQCHGATGEGGVGGEFPAGPSLRKTRLDRAALVETISCGLPGTQMPSWLDGAYTQRSCYGFPPGPAPEGVTLTPVLSANEVEALADFLVANIVGR
jgi:mono/diheme cytochrome c family protein